MKPATLVEWLDAAADTRFVAGPFKDRGGIMIVGPPGSFKTTLIEAALEGRGNALTLSDMNVQQWIKVKPDFVSGRYDVLGFGEFEKLYKRAVATSSHIEGIIHQLIAEGYTIPPGGDPRMPSFKARALVVGGITDDCMERRWDEWKRSGFGRRFLWMVIYVNDHEKLLQAIRQWKLIDFGDIVRRPVNAEIPMVVTKEQEAFIEKAIHWQAGYTGIGFILFKRITAVLNWKYKRDPKRVMQLLKDVGPSFAKNGDRLIL